MLFGQLVVGQVDRGKTVAHKAALDALGLVAFGDGQPDKNMGLVCVRDAVVELGHRARADQLAKALEGAAFFGDRDGKEGFALFTKFSALGNKPQSIKVHVRAAGDGHQGLTFDLTRLHILLDSRHTQGPGGLQDAAGFLKNIFDGGADFVGVDHHVVVYQGACQTKGFLAHKLHGGAVREQTHIVQLDAFACANRLQHGVRINRLHADDADLGPHGLDVRRHARNEAPAADRYEHSVDRALVLAQDFHCHRALACNDVGVVKGVDKTLPLFLFDGQRMRVGIRKTVTVQHHLGAHGVHGIDLQARCCHRHHDGGFAAEFFGCQGHALSMVAC